MKASEILDYCLTKPGSRLDQPWDDTYVVKVADKIFAFLPNDEATATIGLKCGLTREEADEWLQDFPDDAAPMPYLGHRGWNSLRVRGSISEHDLLGAIDASYYLVVSKLPKSRRPLGALP